MSVLVPDTTSETRWPAWAAEMTELGIRSVLSIPIHNGVATIGALNLAADKPYAFDAEDAATAHILARHDSVAVAHARKEAELLVAIDSRKLIGQAQGILMERFNIDADRAFAVLRRYSQTNNVKLHAVAQHLVDTRHLLGSAPGSPDQSE